MDNPFKYGEIVTGQAFTNRRDELDELAADIRNGQNVVIVSRRRFGKTSLVLRACERLREEGVLVAYVDLFPAATKQRFAELLAGSLHRSLLGLPDRLLKGTMRLFDRLSLRFKVVVAPDGTPSFELGPGERSQDIDRLLDDLLALPARIASERKRRVALILDEFQQAVDLDPHLPAIMRAVFQHQTDVSHVFLGSRTHLMQRTFSGRGEPLYRLAKPFPLGPIPRRDFAAFIRERCDATGKAIADAALDGILDITRQHPHDTQELCYFVWAVAHARGAARIEPAHVDLALDRVLAAEDARCRTVWEDLARNQRLLLAALAVEPTQAPFAHDYRHRRALGPASSVQRSLAVLVERDLIESSNRGYEVPDTFLTAWLRRLATGEGRGNPT